MTVRGSRYSEVALGIPRARSECSTAHGSALCAILNGAILNGAIRSGASVSNSARGGIAQTRLPLIESVALRVPFALTLEAFVFGFLFRFLLADFLRPRVLLRLCDSSLL